MSGHLGVPHAIYEASSANPWYRLWGALGMPLRPFTAWARHQVEYLAVGVFMPDPYEIAERHGVSIGERPE